MIVVERKRRGRPAKDRRPFLKVAAAVDWRDDDGEALFFLFRGPSVGLVRSVFRVLVGGGRGIARRAVVSQEHDAVRRIGKGYWRVAVKVVEPNFHFSSLDDMKILIEALMRRANPCSLKWMNINDFLNV